MERKETTLAKERKFGEREIKYKNIAEVDSS